MRSGTRRSHRADTPAGASIPRPLRYVLGAGALAVVLAGSLSFADASSSPSTTGADTSADIADVAGRDDVWAQVSRSDGTREPLLLEAGEPVDFAVTVDGATVELTGSSNQALADALIDAGIVVDLDDVVSAPMGEAPAEGAEITIERVGTHIEAEVTTLPFETVEQRTSRLPSGTTQVKTEGVEGSVVTTFQATYADGEVTQRTELTSVVAAQPVDKVVLVGTGSNSSGSSGSSSNAPMPTYSGADPRSIAQELLAAYGWGSDQWSCLDRLWQRESNWNPHAQNPSSGAYGIPQSLPGSKMATAGSDWRTNPATQITWGLRYIEGRYGSPCGAWGHSQSVGWY
ncbi:G5 domain-containing protein [Pseudactinotalea suaedae]|uniref:aggregation-promoting factor C-terminal-like domain-containing protein n=1 Tax=Pseudactinotalea suaedae TaxID=1524924 RepID=UPI001F4FCB3E|nr:G5 domain-containing protein [Pseudactinotalea suaedae]